MGPDTVKIKLTVVDTLALFNDAAGDYLYNPRRSATKAYWYCLPSGWFEMDTLPADKLELIYEHIYGRSWRSGNGDGSRYIVLKTDLCVLGPNENDNAPHAVNADCFLFESERGFVRISPATFSANLN